MCRGRRQFLYGLNREVSAVPFPGEFLEQNVQSFLEASGGVLLSPSRPGNDAVQHGAIILQGGMEVAEIPLAHAAQLLGEQASPLVDRNGGGQVEEVHGEKPRELPVRNPKKEN